jgi:hypothetical protein
LTGGLGVFVLLDVVGLEGLMVFGWDARLAFGCWV